MLEEEKKQKDEDVEEEDDLEEDDIDEELDNDDEDPEEEEENPEEEGKEDDDKKQKAEQSKEERARHAKARREREAKEREEREKKIREEAYLKGQLEGIKTNPYTKEPIEDKYDLDIYKVQVQLEKEGKDPVADLPARLAKLNRDNGKKAEETANQKKQIDERVDKECAEFKSKYPKVNLKDLLNDPDFKDFADGRLGVGSKTLAQIYENYTTLKKKWSGKTEEEEDDGKATPPSPNGGRKHKETSYSEMSAEEKEKYLRAQGMIK